MRALATVLLFAMQASGHATMVQPMPRNSGGDRAAPSFPGAGRNFPGCAGDACLWYSVGCFIGCPSCSSTGKGMYPTPLTNGDDGHGGPCKNPMEPTNNNATTRTNNPNGKSPHGDWTRYMPWRAPGFAPSMNPCGKAGAFKPSSPNPAEIPAGHHQYDNGTSLPALSGSSTTWKAGNVAEVSWAISANHGGGYQYRLCPKSQSGAEPTEACFQAHVLPFTESTTTIHYTDGSKADFKIPATDVSVGTNPAGSVWRKNPIPMCNCDVGQGCRAPNEERDVSESIKTVQAMHHIEGDWKCTTDDKCTLVPSKTLPLPGCKKCDSNGPAWSCEVCCDGCTKVEKSGGSFCQCGKKPPSDRSDMTQAYENGPSGGAECPTGLQFPKLWAEGYGDGGNCLYPQGPNSPHCTPYMWTMVDKVRVPTVPGDYTLSFRWDCEHTPQVWNQCADITIEA